MAAKIKKALLEATVMALAGIVITVMLFTQTGDIPAGCCFIICGVIMFAQAGCIHALGKEKKADEVR